MNKQAGNINPLSSSYRMSTDAQLDEIHLASLEILWRTGVRVYEAEALALLQDAGCVVTDENLVRFPAAREAINTHTPPPLPTATLDTLRGIVAEADARVGLPPQDKF